MASRARCFILVHAHGFDKSDFQMDGFFCAIATIPLTAFCSEGGKALEEKIVGGILSRAAMDATGKAACVDHPESASEY